MDATVSYKTQTSMNYRTIVNVKNIEVCPVIASVDNFPGFKGYVDWFKNTFPNMVHKCPYKELVVYNATHYKQNAYEQKFVPPNPNGMHKSESSW